MEADEKGRRKLDEHNHLIQKHDLKKIAEAFLKNGQLNRK